MYSNYFSEINGPLETVVPSNYKHEHRKGKNKLVGSIVQKIFLKGLTRHDRLRHSSLLI